MSVNGDNKGQGTATEFEGSVLSLDSSSSGGGEDGEHHGAEPRGIATKFEHNYLSPEEGRRIFMTIVASMIGGGVDEDQDLNEE